MRACHSFDSSSTSSQLHSTCFTLHICPIQQTSPPIRRTVAHMAVTTKQSRNAAKVRLDSVEEESWRPANNKRTISLAGIFDEIRNKRQKGGDVGDDGIQRSPPPRKAVAKTTPRNEEHSGARETGSAAGEFFAQFVSKKKHAQNPIYRDFDGQSWNSRRVTIADLGTRDRWRVRARCRQRSGRVTPACLG